MPQYTANDVEALLREQRRGAALNSSEQRILDTIERLALSWRKGYEAEQRGTLGREYRLGQMGQSEFAIALLLGLPVSTPVREALVATKGHL